MIQHNIYFADNLPDQTNEVIVNLVTEMLPFPGATITQATGVWQGEVERAWCLTIIEVDEALPKLDLFQFCRLLKITFDQQAVLLTSSEVKGVMI